LQRDHPAAVTGQRNQEPCGRDVDDAAKMGAAEAHGVFDDSKLNFNTASEKAVQSQMDARC
jgi:hypothetical protein